MSDELHIFNIGDEQYLVAEKIVAVLSPSEEIQNRSSTINACGNDQEVRSAIIYDGGKAILTTFKPETIVKRISDVCSDEETGEEEGDQSQGDDE